MIGFVVPNQKHFLALADQFGIRGSMEELCNSKAMEELVLKTMTEAALAGETSSKRSWNQSSVSRFCFMLELFGIQLVHFSCRLLLLQPSWSASRSRARSVWARIRGHPRLDWWRTPSSSNARSLRHVTMRTSRGCTVENDEDQPTNGHFQSNRPTPGLWILPEGLSLRPCRRSFNRTKRFWREA